MKQKVLLVNPPVNLDVTLGTLKSIPQALPPIGLGYISSYLLNAGIDVEVLDSYVLGLGAKETVERVGQIRPQIVGVSCLTPGMPLSYKIAEGIKAIDKNTKVIFGGLHPSIMSEEVLATGNVDVVVRGEGEATCLEGVEALFENRSLGGIKGISWRDDGIIRHNLDREYIQKLDALPHPDWSVFPTHLYSAPPHWVMAKPMLPIFASRGCPFLCTFCCIKTMGRQVRHRSPENIADELEYLIENFKIKQTMFLDAAFPCNKKIALGIFEEMIRRKINKKIVWLCETRVDLVDEEILAKMKEAGCRRVIYGVESGVPQLLKNIKKGFTLERVRESVRLAKKAGLEIVTCFILGLPGETEELSKQTIRFAKDLDVDFVKFNLAVPYPGSALYEEAKMEASLKSDDWEKFTSFSAMASGEPVYVPAGMDANHLQHIQRMALLSYYLHPKRLLRYLKKISSKDDLYRYIVTAWSLIKSIFVRYKKVTRVKKESSKGQAARVKKKSFNIDAHRFQGHDSLLDKHR